MNNTATLTQEQMNMLSEGKAITINPPKPKVKRWQPEGGPYYINQRGYVLLGKHELTHAMMGNEFQTMQQATDEAIERRKRARLVAYRNKFCPDYKPDLKYGKDDKYQIIWDEYDNKYRAETAMWRNVVGCVYFPAKIAKELVAKLNSGEVVL